MEVVGWEVGVGGGGEGAHKRTAGVGKWLKRREGGHLDQIRTYGAG